MIVVDASVAVKAFVIEPGSAAAITLMAGADGPVHGPDLLLMEVAGAIVRRANERTIPKEEASAAVGRLTSGWQRGHLHLHRPGATLISQAARLALELGHPLKDCVYLALAVELGCPLVTADVKVREKAAEAHPHVQLLG